MFKILVSCLLILTNYTFTFCEEIPKYRRLGKINKDEINVRTDSTLNASILGYLKKGEYVLIIDEKYEWYKVILPPRFYAYVYHRYIKKVSDNQLMVIANNLNLRSQPSLKSPIIGKVNRGELLNIIDEGDEWIKVKAFPNLVGWVYKSFVDIIREADKDHTTFEESNLPAITN
ncbi:MAG: SH3 domain-containing protein [Candidatus Omnitrophica bacterium]|nr:SH3 domain-containing protein [Candidatus Omnitrophota bacterium]MCM8826132.1 SH3 domain-containing protein [Candidatus Omnitrophota bacterium]